MPLNHSIAIAISVLCTVSGGRHAASEAPCAGMCGIELACDVAVGRTAAPPPACRKCLCQPQRSPISARVASTKVGSLAVLKVDRKKWLIHTVHRHPFPIWGPPYGTSRPVPAPYMHIYLWPSKVQRSPTPSPCSSTLLVCCASATRRGTLWQPGSAAPAAGARPPYVPTCNPYSFKRRTEGTSTQP